MDIFKKTFATCNSTGDIAIVDVPVFHKDMSRSITDRSQYTPDGEAIKRLVSTGSQALTSPQLLAYYDFSDGKDNGMRVPVTRIKGKDIAEISTAIKAELDEVGNKVKDELEKKKLYDSLAGTAADAAANAASDATKTSGQSSTSNS